MRSTQCVNVFALVATGLIVGLADCRRAQCEWTAPWIVPPSAEPDAYGVYLLRHSVEFDEVPQQVLVDVTADQRYRLFVNAVEVALGPCAGNLKRWRYDTVDLASHLKTGENVISAVVWNMGPHTPAIQMSHRTAFRMQANSPENEHLDTSRKWRVMSCNAYRPLRNQVPHYYVVGPGDEVDAAAYPWGWQATSFDAQGWPAAQELATGPETPWILVPREIAILERQKSAIGTIRRATGLPISPGTTFVNQKLVIPARSQVQLLIDHGVLTNAYPELTVSGGKQAEISLTHAESLFEADASNPDRPSGYKGNRDEIKGKQIVGHRDRFVADGGSNRVFRPLWFRTFRYVQLDIATAEEPLVLENFTAEFTGYPLVKRSWFKCNDTTLAELQEIGWRTLRLCANETMYDCPFYERLQYVGDTRTQAWFMRYLSGDDSLPRRALQDFYDSIGTDGLTQSRYPCHEPQSIPTYSLLWISMLHDDYQWRGDVEFIRKFGDGIDSVLKWHEGFLDDSGMLLETPGWRFVDWAFPQPAPGQHAGVPECDERGRSAVISLQLAYTYKQAAELMAALGNTAQEHKYRSLASRIIRATNELCWDSDRKLISDSPLKKTWSQHANILAILTDAVGHQENSQLLEQILTNKKLIGTTVYFQYYLNRALEHQDAGERYLDTIGPWRDMVKLGLSTFAEMPEPTRSDCHAWGSSPDYEFLRLIAGIRPSAPGCKTMRIAPRLGKLSHIDAGMPIPQGMLTVKLARGSQGRITGDINLPVGVQGILDCNGKEKELISGSNAIE